MPLNNCHNNFREVLKEVDNFFNNLYESHVSDHDDQFFDDVNGIDYRIDDFME
jgi:hypothetical protein